MNVLCSSQKVEENQQDLIVYDSQRYNNEFSHL